MADIHPMGAEDAAHLADHAGDAKDFKARAAILQLLKDIMREGRERAESLLHEDRRGFVCATRLSYLQDQIIKLIHRFAIENGDYDFSALVAESGIRCPRCGAADCAKYHDTWYRRIIHDLCSGEVFKS